MWSGTASGVCHHGCPHTTNVGDFFTAPSQPHTTICNRNYPYKLIWHVLGHSLLGAHPCNESNTRLSEAAFYTIEERGAADNTFSGIQRINSLPYAYLWPICHLGQTPVIDMNHALPLSETQTTATCYISLTLNSPEVHGQRRISTD